MTHKKRKEIFESAPVGKAVITQIIPAVASQMITLIYNLADTFFVGRLNSPAQAAAVMVVSSPFILLTAVANLFGIGGASAISRSLGNNNFNNARQISSIVFWMGIMSGILVSLGFFLLASPILRLCGATNQTYEFSYGYAKWVIIYGATFSILSAVLANVLRAEGRAIIAAVGVAMGGVLNIILDPFFILPSFLGMGVIGAGIATAISGFISAIFLFVAILSGRKRYVADFSVKSLAQIKSHLPEIFLSGFPSAIQYALTVVAVAAHSHFVASYGFEAVAALGIVKKLDQLPLFFSIGVASGLLPFLAYTNTAGKQKRHRSALMIGCVIACSFSIICVILYEIFAPILTSAFIADKMTVNYASAFLRRMVIAMPMMSICHIMIIRFQAIGKVKESIICSLLRKGIIDIPFFYFADIIFPLYGLMWVQPIVDTISLITAIIFTARIAKEYTEKTNI